MKNRLIPTHRPVSLPASDRRPSKRQRGYTRRWEKFRAWILNERPICENCHKAASNEAHHLDGLGPNGPRGYDPDNIACLCKPCHSRETGRGVHR
jgi:5-methylcytosine-specific restriction enzyme A